MTRWLRVRFVLDRALALVALVLAAPVLAVVAALVRRDGGPAFISVPRVGRAGTSFGMWKVRTMRAEQGDGRAAGPSLTAAGDDRITPIGRTLRRLHVDELPQFVNVVRGEMVVLGPRPEAPEFVDPDDPAWAAVLEAPPGIAGPTQLVVNDWERELISAAPGGDAYRRTVVPLKLELDRWYLRVATPGTDALVLAALAGRFLPGARSSRLKRRVARDVPASAPVVAWSADPAGSPPPGVPPGTEPRADTPPPIAVRSPSLG